MKVEVLDTAGYDAALLGIGLSYNKKGDALTIKDAGTLLPIARKLHALDGGHNKFLESVSVWLDITAPRYWWSQFDTYRVGMTKQSESTMHTLLKTKLTRDNFEDADLLGEPLDKIIEAINATDNLDIAKGLLPEAFLQRRIVCTNARTIRNMYLQRKNHKLKQWHMFFEAIARYRYGWLGTLTGICEW